MSYQPPYPHRPGPMRGPTPAPGQRPAVITVAALLMMIMAGLGIVHAIATLATLGPALERFRARASLGDASPTDIDNLATAIQVITIASAVLAVLVALLLIGLAFGVLRGSNVARVLTWVVSALGILCGCCGLFGVVAQTRLTAFGTTETGNQAAEDLGRALQEAYPAWWLALGGALSALQLLGYIAIAVLLALPPANAFFRKPPPPWQPPPAM